jgi:transcriptional regulator with XRE-family HTH domain
MALLGNVKIALKARGRTQKELARVLRIDEATLCLRIAGRQEGGEFDHFEKRRVSEFLDVPEEWLFSPTWIPARKACDRRELSILCPSQETR